jgi:hypothetical protein
MEAVVDAGGLMSYGANLADLFRRAATYVTRFSKAPSPATCRRAADEVRAGHQSQDRQGARHDDSALAAAARRSDPVTLREFQNQFGVETAKHSLSPGLHESRAGSVNSLLRRQSKMEI